MTSPPNLNPTFVEEDEAKRLLASGDLDAFFTYIAPLVESTVCKNNFNTIDYEDSFQNAYLKIYKSLSWYDPTKGSVRSFVSGVAASSAYTTNAKLLQLSKTGNLQVESEMADYLFGDEDTEAIINITLQDIIRLLKSKKLHDDLTKGQSKLIKRVAKALDKHGPLYVEDLSDIIGLTRSHIHDVLGIAGNILKQKGLR